MSSYLHLHPYSLFDHLFSIIFAVLYIIVVYFLICFFFLIKRKLFKKKTEKFCGDTFV